MKKMVGIFVIVLLILCGCEGYGAVVKTTNNQTTSNTDFEVTWAPYLLADEKTKEQLQQHEFNEVLLSVKTYVLMDPEKYSDKVSLMVLGDGTYLTNNRYEQCIFFVNRTNQNIKNIEFRLLIIDETTGEEIVSIGTTINEETIPMLETNTAVGDYFKINIKDNIQAPGTIILADNMNITYEIFNYDVVE